MLHPTAIVEKGAELGQRVRVGPYAVIGPHVRLGDDCEVRAHAILTGHTTCGDGNVFFPGSVIGEIPQDLKYQGEQSQTMIGDDNHFREMVTVHSGTGVAGGMTRIGNHNRFFVCVHIAHDSVIDNHVIIANNTGLAGHCHVEDCVTMGGHVGVHHFVTVGRYAMVGGFARITADVPPYLITQGYRAGPRGVNLPGLRRWKLAEDDISALTKAFLLLYGKSAERDVSFSERLERIASNGHSPCVEYLCQFIRRTMVQGRRGRYLESQRRDRPEDNRSFFDKKMVGESRS
jgi:UDP-N-acetylglucosamine acyltransferase